MSDFWEIYLALVGSFLTATIIVLLLRLGGIL